jgi:hypothetical protein
VSSTARQSSAAHERVKGPGRLPGKLPTELLSDPKQRSPCSGPRLETQDSIPGTGNFISIPLSIQIGPNPALFLGG